MGLEFGVRDFEVVLHINNHWQGRDVTMIRLYMMGRPKSQADVSFGDMQIIYGLDLCG